MRREESSNFLGLMSARKHYEGESVSLIEQDTDGDGKFDTWEFNEEGKLVKIGRDTTGDGREDTFTKPSPSMNALVPAKPPVPGAGAGKEGGEKEGGEKEGGEKEGGGKEGGEGAGAAEGAPAEGEAAPPAE